jgi:hypothetical protein
LDQPFVEYRSRIIHERKQGKLVHDAIVKRWWLKKQYLVICKQPVEIT